MLENAVSPNLSMHEQRHGPAQDQILTPRRACIFKKRFCNARKFTPLMFRLVIE